VTSAEKEFCTQSQKIDFDFMLTSYTARPRFKKKMHHPIQRVPLLYITVYCDTFVCDK